MYASCFYFIKLNECIIDIIVFSEVIREYSVFSESVFVFVSSHLCCWSCSVVARLDGQPLAVVGVSVELNGAEIQQHVSNLPLREQPKREE